MSKYINEPILRKAYIEGVWIAVEEIAFHKVISNVIECVISESGLTHEECSIQLELSKSKFLPELKDIYEAIEMAVEYVFD